MNHRKTIYSPSMADIMVFHTSTAAKITVFGIVGNDCITFRKVLETSEQSRFSGTPCATYTPTPAQIEYSAEYQVGGCTPSLHAKRNTLYIAEAGSYLPIINGQESDGSLTLFVEAVDARQFNDSELGISPCGCPCVENEWTWTGNERANGDTVEREYQSNCGTKKWQPERALDWWETGVTLCKNNLLYKQEQSETGKIRWIETQEICGYSASVPIIIPQEDCTGLSLVGYLYSPHGPRPPQATEVIEDCDGNLFGYALPQSEAGHTLPIKKDGKIKGFVANRSDTAPLFAPCPCFECEQNEETPSTPPVKQETIEPPIYLEPTLPLEAANPVSNELTALITLGNDVLGYVDKDGK